MTIHYATYFDGNFLDRGLALYESLRSQSRTPFKLQVLCLDEDSHAALSRLRAQNPARYSELIPHALAELETADPQLLQAKGNRSRIEYYFTLTPAWCLWLIQNQDINRLAYIDADLYFTDRPEILFDIMGAAPAAVIEHRYPAARAHLAQRYGRFNVGWVGFQRMSAAIACLKRWREQCLDWCSDQPGDAGFADQKYLDDWPQTVPGLCVIDHAGANLAPWNLERHHITARGQHIIVDDLPLLFFHFHRLRRLGPGRYETDYDGYGRIARSVAQILYPRYLVALEDARIVLQGLGFAPEGYLTRFSVYGLSLKVLALRAMAFLRRIRGERVFFTDGRMDWIARMAVRDHETRRNKKPA